MQEREREREREREIFNPSPVRVVQVNQRVLNVNQSFKFNGT